MDMHSLIISPERMIAGIRELGIVPFFRSRVPGWSVEDQTDPDFWFYTSDVLGPWDWKIDAVHEGDIAYGKFLSGKAAFATTRWYRHLMNVRRADAKCAAFLDSSQLARTALDIIRRNGAVEMSELRKLCGVKKAVMESAMQGLYMGTWAVVGDIRRVYRGPNLEYKGWQRSSVTTPDALFGAQSPSDDQPFWANIIECQCESPVDVDCTPQESREILIDHVAEFFPDRRDLIAKVI